MYNISPKNSNKDMKIKTQNCAQKKINMRLNHLHTIKQKIALGKMSLFTTFNFFL